MKLIATLVTLLILTLLTIKTVEANQVAITKDLQVTLTVQAERFADIEIWQYNPKNQQTGYTVYENSSTRYSEPKFKLGDQRDERVGCIQMINKRRTGVCEDGIYRFETRTTDAAGNKSPKSILTQIERDTVSPEKPQVNIEKLLQNSMEYLNLKISGEPYATAQIQITHNNKTTTYNQSLDQNGNYQANKFQNYILQCGDIEHKVKVTIIDKAGNYSQIEEKIIQSQTCPKCSYSGGKIAFPVRDNRAVITSDYQTPHRPNHDGVDIALLGGPSVSYGTPIFPVADGTVVRTKYSGGVPGGAVPPQQ